MRCPEKNNPPRGVQNGGEIGSDFPVQIRIMDGLPWISSRYNEVLMTYILNEYSSEWVRNKYYRSIRVLLFQSGFVSLENDTKPTAFSLWRHRSNRNFNLYLSKLFNDGCPLTVESYPKLRMRTFDSADSFGKRSFGQQMPCFVHVSRRCPWNPWTKTMLIIGVRR